MISDVIVTVSCNLNRFLASPRISPFSQTLREFCNGRFRGRVERSFGKCGGVSPVPPHMILIDRQTSPRSTFRYWRGLVCHSHHLCQGVRVVDPKPACGEAFFPPSRGNGLQIYRQRVTAGQSIVIELVFTGERNDEKKVQILAASPVTAGM